MAADHPSAKLPILDGGWTLDALQEHWRIVNELNERFSQERDRRYAEVNIEREKALKIKEEADKAALSLAREIQTYKDEKANQLREQISSERGSYATKADLASAIREVTASIMPLSNYVVGAGGVKEHAIFARSGSTASFAVIAGLATAIATVMTIVGFLLTHR